MPTDWLTPATWPRPIIGRSLGEAGPRIRETCEATDQAYRGEAMLCRRAETLEGKLDSSRTRPKRPIGGALDRGVCTQAYLEYGVIFFRCRASLDKCHVTALFSE